jgi:hypothetical protein
MIQSMPRILAGRAQASRPDGADIICQSALGKGTAFGVTLPPARGAAEAGEFFPTI